MTADEPNPKPRRRKEPAPHVIEGSAKVLAEEPVPQSDADSGAKPSAAADPPPADPDLATEAATGPSPEPGAAPTSSFGIEASESGEPPPQTSAGPSGPRPSAKVLFYAAGGILLGLALAAIAWLFPFNSSSQQPGPDMRLSVIEAKLLTLEQSVAILDKRLGATESGLRETTEALTSVSKKQADTNSRLVDATNASNAAAAAAQTAQDNATRALTVSQQSGAGNESKPLDLTPLQDRLTRLETEFSQPKVEGKSTADRIEAGAPNISLEHAAALAVVAQTLVQAVDRGDPFPQQVAAIEALGGDPSQVAALKPLAVAGVPSTRSLSQKFTSLARSMVALSYDSKQGGDFFSRIWQETAQLVRVRPIGESSGDDAGALVAHIEAALARADTAGALAAWEKLPAAAKGFSQKWAIDLKSRVEAEATAATILTGAIASLGKPRS
jgi:hypothetical protein